MKKSKLVKLLALVLSLTFVLSSCGAGGDKASGSGEAAGKDDIVIGSTFTLSGDVAHAGQMAFEGAKLAVKYVNEELGGINGHKVVLKYYDDEFDESKIPMLYEKLITKDKVDLLLSPYTSPFLAAAPIVHKYDKIMFTVAADSYTANEEYGQDIVNIQMDEKWKGGRWWKDVMEFFTSFDQWNTNPDLTAPKTMAILNLEIAYGHEIEESVVPYLEDHGIDVVYNEYFDPMETDWTPVISKLKQLKPDIVFCPHYFEGCVNFIEKCVELNYSADYMIVEGMSWDPISWPKPDDGGLQPSIAKRGFFGYAVYKEAYKSETKDYLAAYTKEKYNAIPGNDLICGFMAVELAAKAANKAGSTDKKDLIKTLTENTFDLAGYPYTMNETGGNGADFSWGVGQYIPADINNADSNGLDYYCVWPKEYANHDPVYPFPGWPSK
ncbi:MAG: ABC transporter substrate-binding protein [Oscillibacter sp.]|nr:ABC transporter substrate-binding protein [Oscillibacter sp.]